MSSKFEAHRHLPHTLYRFRNQAGELLYVGVTTDLTARLREHRRTQSWWEEVHATEAVENLDRATATRQECLEIARDNPRYNKRRPHPDQIVRDSQGRVIAAGYEATHVPGERMWHTFRGIPLSEYEEFKSVARSEGDDPSELIVDFIRYYMRSLRAAA